MNFMVTAHSDVGIKKHMNQDAAFIHVADTDYGKVLLAVICDGMGGLTKGELASATMIRKFSEWFQEEFPQILYSGFSPKKLKSAWEVLIHDTNDRLFEYGNRHNTRLGTTVVALLIVEDMYYIMNVGDSRAYMLTDCMKQLTKDQTYVQREIDMGRMTYAQSLNNPKRNIILQCIGASEKIEMDFYLGKVPDHAVYMLCSDGFRHVITKEEIYKKIGPQVLDTEKEMVRAAEFLVELNKSRREIDNITVVLIKVSME